MSEYMDWIASEWKKVEPAVITMLGLAVLALLGYKIVQVGVMAYDAWKKGDLTQMLRSLAFGL